MPWDDASNKAGALELSVVSQRVSSPSTRRECNATVPSRGGEGGEGGVLWPAFAAAAADERGLVDTKLSDRREETGVFFYSILFGESSVWLF